MTKISIRNGLLAFLLVLLLMPIGHVIMILNEILLEENKYVGAVILGIIGVVLFIWGIKKNHQPTVATILGFLSAVLIWTGWVEFSFMWVAEKENVAHLVKDGEIATKREYLVMLSSLGILMSMFFYFMFTRSNCTFFIWIQNKLGFKDIISKNSSGFKKPQSVVVFGETLMILWFFYVSLLVVYDDTIAGDRHWATHVLGWGSLIWSFYLISRLIKLKSFDYAIRYAVPTVIIFWNFVEVAGRWGLFEEIWVQPLEYWLEVSLFFISLAILLFVFIRNPSFNRKKVMK
ncbi:MAG: hypothetical protein WC994_05695 [Brumimicrobium sp.]